MDWTRLTTSLVSYCRDQLSAGGGKRAVIGVSGGKDSSVTAALMARAIGADRVYGVILPDGHQHDLDYAQRLIDELGIHRLLVPIEAIRKAVHAALAGVRKEIGEMTNQAEMNIPPRLRMTLLYAISQIVPDGRVINTSNLSEDWVGYATVYGDTAGAFSPLGRLTSEEVIAVGRELGLPEQLLLKTPEDGLTGKSDEEILGFSYALLNRYIREGKIEDYALKARIDALHRRSRFKFLPIPMFNPHLPLAASDLAGVYRD